MAKDIKNKPPQNTVSLYVSELFSYLAKICNFERADDISIEVSMEESDYAGISQIIPETLQGSITIYYENNDDLFEFMESLCHEAAHIFTREYFNFFYIFHEYQKNNKETTEYRTFTTAHEVVARRLTKFLYILALEWTNEDFKKWIE